MEDANTSTPAPSTTRDVAQDQLIEQWSRGTSVTPQATTEPRPFVSTSTPDPLPPSMSLTPSANADITSGLLLMIVGIVITVVTFNAASGGGMYIVAWGPVVFGFLRLMRGLSRGAR